jgi:hypothetical protein
MGMSTGLSRRRGECDVSLVFLSFFEVGDATIIDCLAGEMCFPAEDRVRLRKLSFEVRVRRRELAIYKLKSEGVAVVVLREYNGC